MDGAGASIAFPCYHCLQLKGALPDVCAKLPKKMARLARLASRMLQADVSSSFQTAIVRICADSVPHAGDAVANGSAQVAKKDGLARILRLRKSNLSHLVISGKATVT